MNKITSDMNYAPSDNEEFMNPQMQNYFREKLLAWKKDLLEETSRTVADLQNTTLQRPDITDRASEETDRAIELRARDRQRKLIAKIDAALYRIDEGEYGYCAVTGDPISLARLEARPIATMSVAAQERHERAEKIHRS